MISKQSYNICIHGYCSLLKTNGPCVYNKSLNIEIDWLFLCLSSYLYWYCLRLIFFQYAINDAVLFTLVNEGDRKSVV